MLSYPCDINNLIIHREVMAVNRRWDLNSLFLVTWIVGISVIAIAIFSSAPSLRQSIHKEFLKSPITDTE